MRTGRTIHSGLSNVVQRQVQRAGHQNSFAHTRFVFHRRLICVVFVLFGLVGAPGIASAGPIIVENEDTGGGPALTAEQRNEYAAVRLFDEVFSQKKADVCSLLMAANAINHTPVGDFEGPAGFEQFVAKVWSAFPDSTFAIDDGFSSGNEVTLRWTMTGHHLDAFGDLAATGNSVQIEGLAILRFEQNMIAESWLQYDRMALVEQITAVQAAPEICPPCREP